MNKEGIRAIRTTIAKIDRIISQKIERWEKGCALCNLGSCIACPLEKRLPGFCMNWKPKGQEIRFCDIYDDTVSGEEMWRWLKDARIEIAEELEKIEQEAC